MFSKPLPRFVIPKTLATGATAFYFNVPTLYRKLGCTPALASTPPSCRSRLNPRAPAAGARRSWYCAVFLLVTMPSHLAHVPVNAIMPRRRATITQADVARAIRAARQAGAAEVEVRLGEQPKIIVRLLSEGIRLESALNCPIL